MTYTAETSARRSAGRLAVGRTLACWQRSLAEPVRRAGRTSALCSWVAESPKPPRLRREPLLGRCLGEVLDVEPAHEPAIERDSGRETDRDSDCGQHRVARRPPLPRAVANAEPGCTPAPDRPRRASPPRVEPPPVQQRRRVEREVLCRLAEEPARVSPPRAERHPVAVPPAPKRRRAPIPPPGERRPRPAPCPPETALAPATARAAGRFRDAAPQAHAAAPEVVPGVLPVNGPAAPAELLRRHLPVPDRAGARPSPDRAGARRSHAANTTEPAPRRARLHAPDATDPGTDREYPRPDAPPPRGARHWSPAPERARRSARATEATASPRADLPVPVPVPTASERLGPAPVVTASHPPLYEPDPVGAPTVPISGATLRRGAARDAEGPDFLDSAELTNRIARVLQDEARRHGIEV